MAAASAGLLFVNGLGAIAGPLITGWLMQMVGSGGYFLFIGLLLMSVTAYALYRMTRRAAPSAEDTSGYTAVMPNATPVALELAQEVAIEAAVEQEAAEEDRAAEDAAVSDRAEDAPAAAEKPHS